MVCCDEQPASFFGVAGGVGEVGEVGEVGVFGVVVCCLDL